MFDSANDANQYLRRTICLWDGVPVYIDSIQLGADGAILANAYRIPITNSSGAEQLNIRDKRFNCKLFNLGYMNLKNRAVYVRRRPAREQSQALADGNLVFVDDLHDDLSVRYLSRGKEFAEMLTGRYPSREEALKKLANPVCASVALSRELALKKHPQFKNLFFLEYKGREIAFSQEERFQLPTEFQHLTEICVPSGCLKRA